MPRISQTEGLCRESWRFRKGKKEERAGEHVILFLGFLPKHVSPQDHLCLFNVYPSQIYCSLALQERHTLEACLCIGGVVIIVNISDFVVLKSLSQHWGFYLENVLLCENWRGCNNLLLQPHRVINAITVGKTGTYGGNLLLAPAQSSVFWQPSELCFVAWIVSEHCRSGGKIGQVLSKTQPWYADLPHPICHYIHLLLQNRF